MIFDTLIIGAGPAGIIAAIQLKRAGFNITIIEKKNIGGLLINANKIENYLGLEQNISGKELIKIFKKQLNNLEIIPIKDDIIDIQKQDNTFLSTSKKNIYKSKTVIIATGTKPNKLEYINKDTKQKIFYHINDLQIENQEKEIIIIGGSDAAFDYALNLKNKNQKPTILIRNKVTCLKLLESRAKKSKIPLFYNINVTNIENDTINSNKIIVSSPNKVFKADLALIAIGRQANSPTIKTQNKEGLFLAGDIKNTRFRQIHIATGDAMKTAMKVTKYLESLVLKE